MYASQAVSDQALVCVCVCVCVCVNRGAGTNARVFMVVNGSEGSSGELRLENAPDNFTRGKTDKFTYELQVRYRHTRIV